MERQLEVLEHDDLEPIPGCSNRGPGAQLVKKAHPHSYAEMPRLQHAMARLKWEQGINEVELLFRTDWELRRSARYPVTRDEW